METGLAFHEDMLKHSCPWDPAYPERPERLQSCLDLLNATGVMSQCKLLAPREATYQEILAVHSEEHLQVLEATEDENDDKLEKLSSQYDSVYFNGNTYKAARLAAGCSIEVVDAILQNQIKNGFALIRPPGHHAMHNEFCGYSFLNNAAIAAKYCIQKYNLQRILIVDWDIHHGQGTQRAFYDDNKVLYFSIHRYEQAKFWPHLRESNYDFIGEKSGAGFNVNVTLNQVECGDIDYLYIFDKLLIPIAEQYKPEIIIISAGFDSALGDPKGGMRVTPQCYAQLCTKLMKLGKTAAILEGGYCEEALSYSVLATIKALQGAPLPPLPTDNKEIKVEDIVEKVKDVLGKYWNFGSEKKVNAEIDGLSLIEANVTQHLYDGPPFPTRDFHGEPVCDKAKARFLTQVILQLKNFYNYM